MIGTLLVPSVLLGALRTQSPTLGIGFQLGEPTSITAKKWLNQTQAFDAGIGIGFAGFIPIYADYLWHKGNLFAHPTDFSKDLLFYYGAGAILLFASDEARRDQRAFTDKGRSSTGIALRAPIGLEWKPTDPPLGVFVELVPSLGFVPSVYLLLHGAIGFRYYF